MTMLLCLFGVLISGYSLHLTSVVYFAGGLGLAQIWNSRRQFMLCDMINTNYKKGKSLEHLIWGFFPLDISLVYLGLCSIRNFLQYNFRQAYKNLSTEFGLL